MDEDTKGARVAALIESLRGATIQSVTTTKRHLRNIGKDAVPALIEALKDGNWEMRCDVAEVLGDLRDERAVPALIEALDDDDWEVVENAAEALGKIGKLSVVPVLIRVFETGRPNVGPGITSALGMLDDVRAMEHLIKALKDEHPGVRWRAALGLCKIGDARAVEPLIDALNDDDRNVRSWAAQALRSLASDADIDLNRVRASLMKAVSGTGKERDDARIDATTMYVGIASAVAERKKKDMEGLKLPFRIPKPSRKKMYRMRRAANG